MPSLCPPRVRPFPPPPDPYRGFRPVPSASRGLCCGSVHNDEGESLNKGCVRDGDGLRWGMPRDGWPGRAVEFGGCSFFFFSPRVFLLILLSERNKGGGTAAFCAFVYFQSSFSCLEQVRGDEELLCCFFLFFSPIFSPPSLSPSPLLPPLIKPLHPISSKRYLRGSPFASRYPKADLFAPAARRL